MYNAKMPPHFVLGTGRGGGERKIPDVILGSDVSLPDFKFAKTTFPRSVVLQIHVGQLFFFSQKQIANFAQPVAPVFVTFQPASTANMELLDMSSQTFHFPILHRAKTTLCVIYTMSFFHVLLDNLELSNNQLLTKLARYG